MKLRAVAVVPLLLALAACGGGETSDTAEAEAQSTSTSATTQPPATTKPNRTRQETFVLYLNAGGIFPTPEQVPLLIPAATGNCDALQSTTLPDDEKFDKMVELSMIIGAGKNVFEDQGTAESFMSASIHAYCPEYADLVPARVN